MSKDLIDDRFGRFREIPLELARIGHRVTGLCLSYRPRVGGWIFDGPVLWKSINAGRLKFFGLSFFISEARRMARDVDVIWACSDSFYGIIGHALSRKYSIPLVFDLYDNFEYYLIARLPVLKQLYRWVIRKCDAVTCVSKPLAGLVRSYGRQGPLHVLENGVRKDLFKPLDKQVCRNELNLPRSVPIIGTAGAIFKNRGILALFEAFEGLKPKYPDLHLVLAGPRDMEIPRLSGIIDLGVLPLEKVPLLLNALDVAVICNRENDFGRYCFPQKAREMMACGVPLIAARVGSMEELLADHPYWLYAPDDASSLAEALERRLTEQDADYGGIPDWSDLALELERIFLCVAMGRQERVRPVRPFYSQRLPNAVFDKDVRAEKAAKTLAVLSDFRQGSLNAMKVLDLGCASGIMTSFMAPYFKWIVGTDIDLEALACAGRTKTSNAAFLPSDAMSLPFKSKAFDAVICAHVYEHVPDSAKLMREIHRVLRPGGICFFAAGNRLRLVEPHYRLPLLSILPSPLADWYLAISGKGSRYEEKHLTYWALKRLVSEFEVFDYTTKIILNPEKYSATDLCKPNSLKQKLAILFSRMAYGLVPTYIFLLQKTRT